MVDKKVVFRLLQNLRFYLKELSKRKSIKIEEYLKNYDEQAIVERRIQQAIETIIDIGNHIISDDNLRAATSYRDIFNVLYENRIISKDLKEKLSDFASFRNIIVHEYAELDSAIVYKKFRALLKTLPEFISQIVKIYEIKEKK